MEERLVGFWNPPTVSVLLAVSDPDEVWIKASLSSVLDGIYPHVELCVCDNASERPHVGQALDGLAASDERVKVRRLPKAASLAQAYNEALALAMGRFVTFLGEGDELAPEAFFYAVEVLQDTEADVIYGDEDSVDISDRRSNPVFKPYWSPDMFLSVPYLGRPCVIRRDLVEGLGGLREGFEGAEEHDLMLRVAEKTDRICHVPKMLYRRRTYEREPAPEGSVSREAARRAVKEALKRRDSEATVEPGPTPGSIRVVRGLSRRPTVSVVALVTAPGFASSDPEKESSYPLHEVIPARAGGGVAPEERATSVPVAKAANLAAGRATGEYLLFVRNYRGATSSEWVLELLRQARRDEVGAVGGRVLNGDGSTRNAGSYLNLSKLTGSSSDALPQRETSRFLPVIDHPFNPAAVAIDCMMIRRSVFEDVGGFDEGELPTAFYDLDLCFRLGESGLLNVYTPDASVFSREVLWPLPGVKQIGYMWERWWPVLVKMLHYEDSPLLAGSEKLDEDLLLSIVSV
jgi:hypothetical protein